MTEPRSTRKSLTVQEAARGFLEDVDESVVRPKFDRIAKALGVFLSYLDESSVTQVSSLRIEHVEEFLFVGFPFDEMTQAEIGDIWYSVRRFLKWLEQREYSGVYEEFAARKPGLRKGYEGFTAPRSSRDGVKP